MISVVVILVVASLGAGYLTGRATRHTETLTVISTSPAGVAPQLSAQVNSCTLAGAAPNRLVCTVSLTNQGTTPVQIRGCSIVVNGTSMASFLSPGFSSLTVSPGEIDVGIQCVTNSNTAEPPLGSKAVGSFSLSSGVSVPFGWVWS